MANRYREVPGFEVKSTAEDGEKAVAFLAGADNRVMIELGKLIDLQPLRKQIRHNLHSISLSKVKT